MPSGSRVEKCKSLLANPVCNYSSTVEAVKYFGKSSAALGTIPEYPWVAIHTNKMGFSTAYPTTVSFAQQSDGG